MSCSDATGDELAAPLAGDVPVLLTAPVNDLAFDLASVASSPASRLEGESTLVTRTVIGDDHVAVMVNNRVTEEEIRH